MPLIDDMPHWLRDCIDLIFSVISPMWGESWIGLYLKEILFFWLKGVNEGSITRKINMMASRPFRKTKATLNLLKRKLLLEEWLLVTEGTLRSWNAPIGNKRDPSMLVVPIGNKGDSSIVGCLCSWGDFLKSSMMWPLDFLMMTYFLIDLEFRLSLEKLSLPYWHAPVRLVTNVMRADKLKI